MRDECCSVAIIAMKNRWIIADSLLVGLMAFLVAAAAAGGGHGTYYAAKYLFPYTMISTGLFNTITFPFIVLAGIQYPAYGAILSLANARGKLGLAAIGVFVVHVAAVGMAFVASSSSFCP
jgi:hypothetical protein